MMRHKSATWIVLSKLLGLLFFFMLLYLTNILAVYIRQIVFGSIVIFLNNNVPIIVIMFVIFLITDLFNSFGFPLNLPSPFFSAFGSLFVTQFIFRSFVLLDLIIGQDIFQILGIFSFIVYPIVFVIVLVAGYIRIFREETEEVKGGREKRDYIAKTWMDILSEFRQTTYDFLELIRESINSNRKRVRKRHKKREKK